MSNAYNLGQGIGSHSSSIRTIKYFKIRNQFSILSSGSGNKIDIWSFHDFKAQRLTSRFSLILSSFSEFFIFGFCRETLG